MKLIFVFLILLPLLVSCSTGPSIEQIHKSREADSLALVKSFKSEVWDRPLNEIFGSSKASQAAVAISLPNPARLYGNPATSSLARLTSDCNPVLKPNYHFQIYYTKLPNGYLRINGYLGIPVKAKSRDGDCEVWIGRRYRVPEDVKVSIAEMSQFNDRSRKNRGYYGIYTSREDGGDFFNKHFFRLVIPRPGLSYQDLFTFNYFLDDVSAYNPNFIFKTRWGRMSSFVMSDLIIDPKKEFKNSLSEIYSTRMNIDFFFKKAKANRDNHYKRKLRNDERNNARIRAKRAKRRAYEKRMSGGSGQGGGDAQAAQKFLQYYGQALSDLQKKRATRPVGSSSRNAFKSTSSSTSASSSSRTRVERCSAQDSNCNPNLVYLCRDNKSRISCFNIGTRFAQNTWTVARALNISGSMECAQKFSVGEASVLKVFSANKRFGSETFASPMTACRAECTKQAKRHNLSCR